MTLIDFEYVTWSWPEFDLADYINETINSNGYSGKYGMLFDYNNVMDDDEIEYLCRCYLQFKYKHFIMQ